MTSYFDASVDYGMFESHIARHDTLTLPGGIIKVKASLGLYLCFNISIG